MGAIAILLGLGICIFLFWFFESVMKDLLSDEIKEGDYQEVYLDKANVNCEYHKLYHFCWFHNEKNKIADYLQ